MYASSLVALNATEVLYLDKNGFWGHLPRLGSFQLIRKLYLWQFSIRGRTSLTDHPLFDVTQATYNSMRTPLQVQFPKILERVSS